MSLVGAWLAQGVALALLLSTSWSLGKIAGRVLRVGFASRWESVAVSLALGLAVLGQLLWLLAAAALLRVECVAALAVAAHLAALPRKGDWRTWCVACRAAPRASIGWAIAGALLLLPCFAMTLFPPHSFDELTYHLPFARGLAEAGALNFQDELRFATFPQLAELLQAALLLTAGEAATHLVQFSAALATCGLLLVWVGGRPTWTGLLAVAAFFGGPIVVFYAATGSVDLVLTLLVALSVWALERWDDGREGALGWPALSGLAAGSATAVKYLGLFAVVAGVLWLLAARPEAVSRRRRAAGLLAFGFAAAVAAAPTFLWIYWVTGNPLFPFLGRILGASAWQPASDLAAGGAGWRGLLWPFDAVFARANVNWQPPFAPAFLLALPIALWGAVRQRRARTLTLSAVAWTLLLPVLPADSRYGLPALPLWLAAAALTLAHWPKLRLAPAPLEPFRRPRAWLPVAVFLLAVSGPAYAWSKMLIWGSPSLAQGAGAARFLSRRLPEYELIRPLVEDPAPGVVYFYGGESLRGLLRGRVLGDWSGPYRFSWIPELASSRSGDGLCRVLRGWRVERFVWFSSMAPPPSSFTGLGPCFEEQWRNRHGVVLRVTAEAAATAGTRAPAR